MSFWTNVRIIYDVDKLIPRKSDYYYNKEESHIAWDYVGIDQLFNGFMRDRNRPKLEELGSEGGVDIELKPDTKCALEMNPLNWRHDIVVPDSGLLIITGNLRDCMKDDFVKTLNEFRKYLDNYYGISVVSAVIKIDGTWVHECIREYQISYYRWKKRRKCGNV